MSLMFFAIKPLSRQRAYSIKTRIKTGFTVTSVAPLSGQRAYSIKTRIKTPLRQSRKQLFPQVREHIPLKQGLRQNLFPVKLSQSNTVREHIPLKQGLRPSR